MKWFRKKYMILTRECPTCGQKVKMKAQRMTQAEVEAELREEER